MDDREGAAGPDEASRRADSGERSEALHQELSRLPAKFRLPIVLCHLEGLTHDEAARRLRARYPGLVVEVALSNATADVLEQEVDVAVRMHPPRQAALVAKKVGAIPLGLFAHVAYLARRGRQKGSDERAELHRASPERGRSRSPSQRRDPGLGSLL